MGSRAARGDGRLCRGRGSASHGTPGRLRRQLRSRQPPLDQRALRLPPQPCPGAGHRRADSRATRSGAAISRRRIRSISSRSAAHYCETISQPEQMPRVLEIAIQTAIARRGVAVIVLPGDVALRGRRRTFAPPALSHRRGRRCVLPTKRLAVAAKHPERVDEDDDPGGAGCAGAHDELVSLAGKLKAPIVHAMRGKEFIEYDNPFDVGMTGLAGVRLRLQGDDGVRHAPDARDRLPVSAVLSQARDRHPDRHPRRAARPALEGGPGPRRRREDHGGGAGSRSSGRRTTTRTSARRVEHYRRTRASLDDLAVPNPGRKVIHPQYVASVRWTGSPPTTRSSRATWARRRSGPPAT